MFTGGNGADCGSILSWIDASIIEFNLIFLNKGYFNKELN